jgi:hypothetical protein
VVLRTLQRKTRRLLSCRSFGLPFVLMAVSAFASANPAEDLKVIASFSPNQLVKRDANIELHLSRELKPEEGRIGIIIGRTDVTSLFVPDGTRLVYSPTFVPLPIGKSQVVIYLVNEQHIWRELGRLPLVVAEQIPTAQTPAALMNGKASVRPSPSPSVNETERSNTTEVTTSVDANASTQPEATTPAASSPTTEPSTARKRRWFGFDKMNNVPSVNVAVKSQPAQFNFPDSTRPAERATFTDGTLQFSMRSEMSRGWLGLQTTADFAGSTFQPEALRFGTLGEQAPQIDLSSYLIQLQLGRAKVAIGHTSFGSSRHLVNSFSSRGVTVTVPIAKRFDIGTAVLNGTSVVGYGNFFGLAKSTHQLQSMTFGVELLPKRPGGLRVEFSGINAYIQALNSFAQGSVNDVDQSRGGSIRLIATDKSGRFKFEGGFSRSQFRNPADPLLYQGTNTIPVPFLTRNARYFDVSVDVLRGYSLTKTKQVNLSFSFRHEQVDPLYKSLGASAQADKAQNDFQLSASIGEISLQASHGRFNDNLRDVPSILKSLTRSKQFSVALPAAALWGGTSITSKFLPRLSYSFSEVHQFGAAIPVNGGFETDPSTVPDQVSMNQNLSADWQIDKVSVGYSYNRSFTNNQQIGRALADFLNQTTGARVGFSPTNKLTFNFDLTRDSASDLEGAKLLRTWRVGTTASWTIGKHITWTAGISNTIAGDRARTNGSRNTEFDTQCSYRVGIDRGELKKVQTQMFIRYADRYARSQDLVFQTFNLTRVKILNAGLNITIF